MIKEEHIQVTKQARILVSGEASEDIEYLWIACHGYGQNVDRFINKFKDLDSRHLIVCPEGLSRFYAKGLSGDVAASWMTKRDRIKEIEDHTNYLQQVYSRFVEKCPKAKIILFGFSQGTATICRWFNREKPKADIIIMWAGSIPQDLNIEKANNEFTDTEIHFVYGSEDQYINTEQLEKLYKIYEDYGFDHIKKHKFEGKHTVDRPTLVKLTQAEIES
jgi:predicted esterase